VWKREQKRTKLWSHQLPPGLTITSPLDLVYYAQWLTDDEVVSTNNLGQLSVYRQRLISKSEETKGKKRNQRKRKKVG
jgi:hypothetical protein